MLRETAVFSRVSPLTAALAPQRRKGRVAAEQLQKTYGTSYFAARPLRPSGTSPVPGEARHINSLQASRPACCFFGSRRAAIRSRDRALGHGPQKIRPATMSIPGRQARYSFPPRHSFRALQRTARKRSPQVTRLISHFFGHLSCPRRGKVYQQPAGVAADTSPLRAPSRPFRHRKNAPAAGASAFFIFYPIFKERGNTF